MILIHLQKLEFNLGKYIDQEDIDETIEELRTTKKWKHYRTTNLLDYMFQKGALPECELIVDVSW
jgi:hypothetical protein